MGGQPMLKERASLRVLKVELRGDLVDKCLVGDLVQVVGVQQAIELDAAQGRGSKGNKLVFATFVDANSIVATRSDEREVRALTNAAQALLPSPPLLPPPPTPLPRPGSPGARRRRCLLVLL